MQNLIKLEWSNKKLHWQTSDEHLLNIYFKFATKIKVFARDILIKS